MLIGDLLIANVGSNPTTSAGDVMAIKMSILGSKMSLKQEKELQKLLDDNWIDPKDQEFVDRLTVEIDKRAETKKAKVKKIVGPRFEW